MNAPAAQQTQTVKAGQAVIIGRVMHVRKAGESFLHLITMPAPDEYSSPQTVAITAKKRLGEKDESVKVLCKVGGFRRQYKHTDADTGEIKNVWTADNRLMAVETE